MVLVQNFVPCAKRRPERRESGGYSKLGKSDYVKAGFWGGRLKNRTGQGLPDAYFPASELCDFKEKFGPHSIIINCESQMSPSDSLTDPLDL